MPPCFASWPRRIATRSCTPPPHTRLHGRHSSHLYVQWTGQGKSLQFRCSNLSAAVCVHSRPPCAALTAICLVRFCTPPAHGREHLAHRDQLESLQSTGSGVGAGVGLDVGDAVGDGVGAAVGAAVGFGVGDGVGAGVGAAVGVAVGLAVGLGVGLRVGHALVLQKRARDRGHVLPPYKPSTSTTGSDICQPLPQDLEHSVHGFHLWTQFCGQLWLLQVPVSCVGGHLRPPCSGRRVGSRVLCFMPPPQGSLHSPHLLHLPTRQSMG